MRVFFFHSATAVYYVQQFADCVTVFESWELKPPFFKSISFSFSFFYSFSLAATFSSTSATILEQQSCYSFLSYSLNISNPCRATEGAGEKRKASVPCNNIFIRARYIDLHLFMCNRHNLQSSGSVSCPPLCSGQCGHNDEGRAGLDARQEINTSGNKMQTQQLLQRNWFALCVCEGVSERVCVPFCMWTAPQETRQEGTAETNDIFQQGHCWNTSIVLRVKE